MAFQEPFLFGESVAENILLGADESRTAYPRPSWPPPRGSSSACPADYDTVRRRAGRHAVGRPAPAGRPRPGPRPPAPAAAARRRHVERRPDDRGRDPRRPDPPPRRDHPARRRQPAVDDRAGRRGALHGGGPAARPRAARRAAGQPSRATSASCAPTSTTGPRAVPHCVMNDEVEPDERPRLAGAVSILRSGACATLAGAAPRRRHHDRPRARERGRPGRWSPSLMQQVIDRGISRRRVRMGLVLAPVRGGRRRRGGHGGARRG